MCFKKSLWKDFYNFSRIRPPTPFFFFEITATLKNKAKNSVGITLIKLQHVPSTFTNFFFFRAKKFILYSLLAILYLFFFNVISALYHCHFLLILLLFIFQSKKNFTKIRDLLGSVNVLDVQRNVRMIAAVEIPEQQVRSSESPSIILFYFLFLTTSCLIYVVINLRQWQSQQHFRTFFHRS